MEKILECLLDFLFNKNKEGIIFGVKSFAFLILIIFFVGDKLWDLSSNLNELLSEDVVNNIMKISNIGIYFFSSFTIVSFVVVLASAIIYGISDKIIGKHSKYFHRMRLGTEIRLGSYAEDILLFLLIGYIFDKSIFTKYIMSFYNHELTFVIIMLIVIYEFFTSTVWGILNRFFSLDSYKIGEDSEESAE